MSIISSMREKLRACNPDKYRTARTWTFLWATFCLVQNITRAVLGVAFMILLSKNESSDSYVPVSERNSTTTVLGDYMFWFYTNTWIWSNEYMQLLAGALISAVLFVAGVFLSYATITNSRKPVRIFYFGQLVYSVWCCFLCLLLIPVTWALILVTDVSPLKPYINFNLVPFFQPFVYLNISDRGLLLMSCFTFFISTAVNIIATKVICIYLRYIPASESTTASTPGALVNDAEHWYGNDEYMDARVPIPQNDDEYPVAPENRVVHYPDDVPLMNP